MLRLDSIYQQKRIKRLTSVAISPEWKIINTNTLDFDIDF